MFCAVRQKINISKRAMYLTILRFDFMEIIMILVSLSFDFLYSFAKIQNKWENNAWKSMFFTRMYQKDVKMLRRVKIMLRLIRQQKYWLLIIKYI